NGTAAATSTNNGIVNLNFPEYGVNAMTFWGNDLYVGGNFTTARTSNSVVTANNIAKWDGIAWSALGSGSATATSTNNGVSDVVNALAAGSGELYVGGYFLTVNNSSGAVPATMIAKWNGTTWNTLGTGLNGNVRALVASGNQLIAGGDFTVSGDGSKVNSRFGIYNVVANPLSVVAGSNAAALHLYPNPASGQATLTGAPRAAAVQVFDVLGRRVLTTKADATGTAQLTLPAALPAGVYVVRAGELSVRLVRE
ncbi:T9SS type A sorting domain-containing protein, partial [Hymenobacter persicinus]